MATAEWRGGLERLPELQIHGGKRGEEEACSVLKLLVHLSLDIQNRVDISERDIVSIVRILELYKPSHPAPPHSHPLWEVWSEALKLLRNLCAEVPSNQTLIINHPTLLTLVAEFSWNCLQITKPPVSKVAMQLLGNVCVGQRSGQEAVWQICFPRLYRAALQGDGSHGDMACMLLHYSTMDNTSFKNQLCMTAPDLVHHVTHSLMQSEWSSLLMGSLLSSQPLRRLWQCYDHMTVEQLILLRFALAHIDPTHPKPHPSSYLNGTFPVETKGAESSVDADNVEFLVDTFQSFSRSLLEQESHLLKEAHHFTGSKGVATPPTTFSTTGDDPYVGVGVAWSALPLDFITVRSCHSTIRLLCRYAVHRHLLKPMQDNMHLLYNLLAVLHELCTLDGSVSSTKNLSNLRTVLPREEEVWCPLYGFKCHLVQLLGNLLFQSRETQDYVRERGGVTLILNQCGIDHRNPYIAQWAIFAIRNLCEGNPANQRLITSLRAVGVDAVDSDALEQSGGEVEVGEDGRLKVKTADMAC